MDETAVVDEKGRLVLPKRIRDEAQIRARSKLVIRAIGEGRIELFDPDLLMRRAQDLGSRKLVGWQEEDHEASEVLKELAGSRADEDH
ncbi:AbrB/MazE/SpoVT family DNA-binding domain-containing protein [Candidatus Bathyarchaeota archaeon]|nr:AbrB/MazE/SpoVT family DNA-binding domain-containing protein [Candidatus Bathyarchaeota archaeon]